ncbi:iron-regulated protein A [Vibrio sp. S4M6]|uniref:imelysin family protein n=1 Tax=Vibrio sinus TaxID=2946865 RepID=UPI00202A8068|nr:imelysin family protein [Vibrio sinus]MCL9780235.1 iron-regulated protein A [Vibrio sinus]
MKLTLKFILYPLSLALVGCQSTQLSTSTDSTVANSNQSVYGVECAAAEHFAHQAKTLTLAFQRYCSQPKNNNSDASVKSVWYKTMQAWMALQGQEVGPEKALQQSWNIQFWPDKKNTTGRKMLRLLQQNKSWTATEISQQSVAVQGLGSLEWLLYDSSSTLGQDNNSCDLAVAISKNLERNALAVSKAWEKDNPWRELTDSVWLATYTSLLSHQLDYTMKKLSLTMAKIGYPKPYFAESWRSKTSIQNIKFNVLALQRLYVADGHGMDRILRSRGDEQLANSIQAQFESILASWPNQHTLFEMLQTHKGYQSLLLQFNKLYQLRYLIQDQVPVKLGVTIGFNSTDGD